MDEWIDCRIKKLHYLMPDINFLCLLLNRWDFQAVLDVNNREINYEFKQQEEYEDNIIQF
ncbi:hypothetical protein GCM10010912_59650 [Paenibacillus albidus]|uniref:Uncharacterized protein n=1 Tax=Paenibacillus albidus TaxID=2041023 RepID=A0A917D1E8_9BACL|nr:hypothetical protein [Paenibacillus albidus]GGG07056.1 hypothetical protein GCM10010912_59650 [Paenibacillus albidus]